MRPTGVYTARGPADGEDWAAVAAALNERMQTRRVGQKRLAELSGISVSTLRLLQHGSDRRVQDETLTSVCRALDWPDDHLARVLTADIAASDTSTHDTATSRILATLAGLEDRLVAVETKLAAIKPQEGRGHDDARQANGPQLRRVR